MNETPFTPAPEQPKKSNTWIWIVGAVVLLCCCCAGAAGAWWLWNNGDRLMQGTSLILQSLT